LSGENKLSFYILIIMPKPVELFKKQFQYLIEKSNCNSKFEMKVKGILNDLITNDYFQKTRFEYSLQIINGKLNDGLRFVNYDTNYLDSEEQLYLKRVSLIEKIASSCCKQSSILDNFFGTVKRLTFVHLPLYIGLELNSKKDLSLKLYLNFFSLFKKDAVLSRKIIRYILDELNSGIRIKNRGIALLGWTLNNFGEIVNHKIYYLYNRQFNLSKSGFSQKELSVFNWLNQYNRLSYFDIMERYNKQGQLISKKIEVHPKNNKIILKSLFDIYGNQNTFLKLQEIVDNINSAIEALGIEKEQLTIYVTMKNYGYPQILL